MGQLERVPMMIMIVTAQKIRAVLALERRQDSFWKIRIGCGISGMRS